jgi:aspartyl-tRNA(Asn)/glutamyl-tRNA(Gln) amidotransferase subunit A
VERDYFFYSAVDPEVAKAVDEAIAVIESLGVSVVEVEIPNLDLVVPAGLSVLLADTSEWHQPLLRQKGDQYVKETRLMLELGEITLATSYARAQKVRSLIREGVQRAFDENDLDAIAAPSAPVTTMPVEQLSVDLTGAGETALSALIHHGFLANVIGIPALSVPVGFSSRGLPIGMQLMGRPFGESQLFSIGDAYQTATDWHLRHPEWVESETA